MTAKTTPTTDDAETGLRLLLRVSSDYVTGVGLTGVPARQFQAVLDYPDLDGDAYDLAVEAAAAELDLLDAAADRVDAGQAVRK